MESEEIHRLLQSLETKHTDDNATIFTLNNIRKHAMATKTGVQCLVKNGCIPRLLKLLYHHVSGGREGPEVKGKVDESKVSVAISIVSNLLMEREARQQVKRDGIETLGAVLAEYSVEEIQVRCCRALGNLAMDTKARSTMAHVKLAPTLIKLLEVQYVDMEEEAFEEKEKSVAEHATKDEKEKTTAHTPSKMKADTGSDKASTSKDEIQDLVETVFPSLPLVQAVCRSIRYLVDDIRVRQQLIDNGMVWVLSVLMKSDKSEMVACVVRVLSELWVKMNKKVSERMSSEVVRAGVMRKTMDMVIGEDEQLSHQAFIVLLPLTQHPHAAALIGASGGVPFFLDLLASPRWHSSHKDIMSGLCQLAKEAVNRIKIREGGGLKVFLDTLRDDSLAGVHDRVVSSLVSFLYDDISLDVLLEDKLVDVLLTHLQVCGGYSSEPPINFCQDAKELLECDVSVTGSPGLSASHEHETVVTLTTAEERLSTTSKRAPFKYNMHHGTECSAPPNLLFYTATYTVDSTGGCAHMGVKGKITDSDTMPEKQTTDIEGHNLTDGMESSFIHLKDGNESRTECGKEETETSVSVIVDNMTTFDANVEEGDDVDATLDRCSTGVHTYSIHSPTYQAETTWHMQNYHPGITRKMYHHNDPYMSPTAGSSCSDDSGSVSSVSSPYSPLSADSYHSLSCTTHLSSAYSSAGSSPAYSYATLSPSRSICESQPASPVYQGLLSSRGSSSDILPPLSSTQPGSPSWSIKGSPSYCTPVNMPLLFSSSEDDSCDVDDAGYFFSKSTSAPSGNACDVGDTSMQVASAKSESLEAEPVTPKARSDVEGQHDQGELPPACPISQSACDEKLGGEILGLVSDAPIGTSGLGFNTDHILDSASHIQGETIDFEVGGHCTSSALINCLVHDATSNVYITDGFSHMRAKERSNTQVIHKTQFLPAESCTERSFGHSEPQETKLDKGPKHASDQKDSSAVSHKGTLEAQMTVKVRLEKGIQPQTQNSAENPRVKNATVKGPEGQAAIEQVNAVSENLCTVSEMTAQSKYLLSDKTVSSHLLTVENERSTSTQTYDNVSTKTDDSANRKMYDKTNRKTGDSTSTKTDDITSMKTDDKNKKKSVDIPSSKSSTNMETNDTSMQSGDDVSTKTDSTSNKHSGVKRFLSTNGSECEEDTEERSSKRRKKLKQPGEYAAVTQNNILILLSRLSVRDDLSKQLASSKVVYCLLDHLALAQEPQDRCVRVLSRIMSSPHCLDPLLAMCAPAVIVRSLMLDPLSGTLVQLTPLRVQPPTPLKSGHDHRSPAQMSSRSGHSFSSDSDVSSPSQSSRKDFVVQESVQPPLLSSPSRRSKSTEKRKSGAICEQGEMKSTPGAPSIRHQNQDGGSYSRGGAINTRHQKQDGARCSQGERKPAIHVYQTGARLLEDIGHLAICPFGEGVVSHALRRHAAPRQLVFATSLLFLLPYWSREKKQQTLFSLGILDKLLSALCTPHTTNRAIKEAVVTGMVFLLHHLRPKFRFDPQDTSSLLHKAVSALTTGTSFDEVTTLGGLIPMCVDEKSYHSECHNEKINLCAYSATKKDLLLRVGESKAKLYASREVLKRKSDMFSAMLQGSYIESTQSEITITDCTPESLEFILHFLHGCDEHCSVLLPGDNEAFMASHRDLESLAEENMQEMSQTNVQYIVENQKGEFTQEMIKTNTNNTTKSNPVVHAATSTVNRTLGCMPKEVKTNTHYRKETETNPSESDEHQNCSEQRLQNCLNTIMLADRFLLPDLAHYLCSVLSCHFLDKVSAFEVFQFAAFHGLTELAEDSLQTLLLSPHPLADTANQVIELTQSKVGPDVKSVLVLLIRRGMTNAGK